jgi:hypothetical protein
MRAETTQNETRRESSISKMIAWPAGTESRSGSAKHWLHIRKKSTYIAPRICGRCEDVAKSKEFDQSSSSAFYPSSLDCLLRFLTPV